MAEESHESLTGELLRANFILLASVSPADAQSIENTAAERSCAHELSSIGYGRRSYSIFQRIRSRSRHEV